MVQDIFHAAGTPAEREIDLTDHHDDGHDGSWIAITQEVLALLGRKWVVPVVRVLLNGPHRNFQLQYEIKTIQPKVLRETLRALERDGLIERVLADDETGGKCIAYQLTRLGQSLPELLGCVFDWGADHLDEVHASRGSDDDTVVSH